MRFRGREVVTHGDARDRWIMITRSYELYMELTEHLLKVFLVEKKNMSLSSRRPISPDFFLFKFTDTFDVLEFHFPPTAKQLRFALGNLSINSFMLTEEPKTGSQYVGPLTMNSMFVTDALWISKQALLNMNLKKGRIHKNAFTNSVFNELIKKWYNGGLKELEMIDITMNPVNRDDIFKDINTSAYDGISRPECWE